MDREITKKERELDEARFQKERFVSTFSHYFKDYEETLKKIEDSAL